MPETAPIELTFRYTVSELAAAHRCFLRRFWGVRDAIIAILLVAFGVFSWITSHSRFGLALAGAGVWFLAFMPIIMWLIPYILFRREPKLQDEYRLTFTTEGIHFQTRDIDSQLKWPLYQEMLESNRFLLLLYAKRSYTVIPKRAFASQVDLDRFKELFTRSRG